MVNIYLPPCIGPAKQKILRKNVIIFLPWQQSKYMFWVLKRTVSLRRFFWVPTTYVFVENKKSSFQLRTFNWRPVLVYLGLLQPLNSESDTTAENVQNMKTVQFCT